MKNRVVTFGEIMLRLSPPDYLRLIQTETLEATYGGGEANVAVSLANYGLHSVFITRLPDNLLGKSALNHLRRFGVDTTNILFGGNRLGIYFAEKGASQRPSVVVYDREGSAISEVGEGMVPWAKIFQESQWFHFTGITPALGQGAAKATLEAVRQAKAMGLTVSCDLNYRKKLWTPEQASEVMSELMEYVDIVVGNEEDAEKVFGIKAAGSDVTSAKIDDAGYHGVMRELKERFSLKAVAITLRVSYSASENGWSALLCDGEEFYKSKEYRITIVDRIGGGDSFCGGLIYSMIRKKPHQEALDFAVAASCMKQTIPGDFNHVTVSEVEQLAKGDASGRVQR